jgi:peptidoglycan/LPS O-acetylase OafA/YrhL
MIFSRNQSRTLKGIAIALVLEDHWLCQALGLPLPPLGCVGVFIFLVLSGYGIANSLQRNNKVIEFAKKRLIKVYFPYLVMLLIMFFMHRFHVEMAPTIYEQDFLEYLFFIKLPHGIIWYLRLQFFWYVFALIGYKLVFKNNKKLILLLLFLLSGSFIISLFVEFQRLYVWQFFSFPLGILLYLNEKKIASVFDKLCSKNFLIVEVMLTVLLFIFKKTTYVETRELGFIDTLLQCGLTITVGMLCIGITKYFVKWKIIEKILCKLGECSYELYLAHIVAIEYFYANSKNVLVYGIVTIVCFIFFMIYTKRISVLFFSKVKEGT